MECKVPLPAADAALYNLYQVKNQHPKREDMKSHPYQSFNFDAISKSAKKSDVTENAEEFPPQEAAVTKPALVSELEGRAHENEKVPDDLQNLMNKLKLSRDDSQPFSQDSVNNSDLKAKLPQSGEGMKTSGCLHVLETVASAQQSVTEKANGQKATDKLLSKLKLSEEDKSKLQVSGDGMGVSLHTVHHYSEKRQVGELQKPPMKEAQPTWKIIDFKSENIVSAKRKKTRKECARCILCRYDIDLDEAKIKAHIVSEEHVQEKVRVGRSITLDLLPHILKIGPHTAKLDELVSDIELMYCIPPDKLEQGERLFKKYAEIVASKDPEKRLILTGSMVHGIAVPCADVNFGIQVSWTASAFQEIHKIKTILSEITCVEGLRMEPTGILHFVDKPTSQKITISVVSGAFHDTDQMLKEYAHYMKKRNGEAWKVVICFRAWANICGLDSKDDGMMHGYMFVIMAICILQILKQLPVMSKMSEKELENWKPKENRSTGELWRLFWLQLANFKFRHDAFAINDFSLPRRDEKKWGVKRLAIACPGDSSINLCRDIPCSAAYDHLMDVVEATAYYFGIPQLRSGPLFDFLELPVRPQPKQRFRKLSEEKTEAPRKRTNSTQAQTFESEKSERKNSTRRESSSSEDARQRLDSLASGEGLEPVEDEEDEITIEFQEEVDIEYQDPSDVKKISLVRTETETYDRILLQSNDESSEAEEEDVRVQRLDGVIITGSTTMSVEHANRKLENLTAEDFFYKFEERLLMAEKKLLRLCMLCKSSGHNSRSCPEVRLPPVKPLPEMTHVHYMNLEHSLYAQCERLKPTGDELMRKKKAIAEIEMTVRQRFCTAIIQPFGSCNNGFGCAGSDLDLCLMFENKPTGEGVDGVLVVNQLASHLRRNRNFRQVIAISNAKVPIVKAYYLPYDIEVDISVYNTLGIHNTRLLYTYASMDERVQNLGYLAKSMAKLCDIGDASKGSLSSYAYILMVLFYAQRCHPPLVPNLQEFYVGDSAQTPQRMVDGWNTWFFELNQPIPLEKLWPGYRKNASPLSVLWLDFLSFYSQSFDWTNFVISIRQSAPLPKLDKSWADRELCIEDPFNLAHNLGGGLTLKMATHIKAAFIQCREHFGFPVTELPPGCNSPQEYFWNAKFLVKSDPPKDRPGCFICGCIRHRIKDCPKRQQRSNRKDYRQNQGGQRTNGKHRPLWTERPENEKGNQNGNSQFRQRNVDSAGEKYQPKVKSHVSESDTSHENGVKPPRQWEKYLPKWCGKNRAEKSKRKNESEDWPGLPTSNSSSGGGFEPPKDSNAPNRGASKKVELGQLQARVFGARERKSNRTNKKRNLPVGDAGDLKH